MKPASCLRGWSGTTAKAILTCVAVLTVATAANAVDISGAGATFPYPVYARWADAFKKATGNNINYQSIGSGGGIKQITARRVTFAASDRPLSAKALADADLVQWPMVLGGVVPVINVDGISSNELTLDGDTLAKIFLGEIKTWDDARIKALNPGAKLPSASIVVVHQSDGSGATFNFTNYLSKVSADWKSKMSSDTFLQWPGGIGARGCEGVAAMIQQTKNAIGYVELAYAHQNEIATTKLVNREGKSVAADAETVQAAAANADWDDADGFGLIITDQPGVKAWPISAATFILMPRQATDTAAAKGALEFFSWALAKGDGMAAELDYVPVPERVKRLALSRFASIKGPDSGPLCLGTAGCYRDR